MDEHAEPEQVQHDLQTEPGRPVDAADRRPTPGRPPGVTRKIREDRVIQVAKLLVNRVPKHQIKKALRVKYGLGARSTEAYIARAREYLIEQSGRSREEWVAEMLGVYEQALADPAADADQKFGAADRICRLLGLDKPIKIAPTNPEGDGPAEVVYTFDLESLTDDELRVLRKMRSKVMDVQAKPATVALGGPACGEVKHNG
jgi:hypothetical protein